MIRGFAVWLLIGCCATQVQAASISSPNNLAQALIAEVNLARTQPAVYAEKLLALKQNYYGYYLQQGDKVLLMQEGEPAVDEAINFLQQAQPLPPLRPVNGLAWAAFDHVKDQSKQGNMGHTGSDHSTIVQRVQRYGRWQGSVGENIRYGLNDAETIVIHWLINDGLTTRSHRQNVFEASYHVTGSACGPHPKYGQMCVMTYANGFSEY